jgi:hypothetical protein
VPGFDESVLPSSPTVAQDIPSLVEVACTSCVIRLRERGYDYWRGPVVDIPAISKKAVVYMFEEGNEKFIVNGVDHLVKAVDTAQRSFFARPTFGSLREALQRYRPRIRHSSCFLFAEAWEDGNRLFFRSHAEKHMRRSLLQYLDNVLRDAEVRPEQIVDESHPVDIKVTWMYTTRLALIEIKWLGKSRVDGQITASYDDSRANKGAKQLADYLDANRTRAPEHQTKGYLVVVDGRRRNLNNESQSVTREDGLHYANIAIKFAPEYHKVRDDFEEPTRIFVEPICTAS